MQNAECRISVADLPRYNFYSVFRREKAEVKGKEKIKIFSICLNLQMVLAV